MMSKVQEELDSVIGPNRLVREADIPDLEYLQAVVKEALRLHPSAPMLIPHLATEACTIGEYYIPEGTNVFVNLWGIQRDAKVWERPLEFEPDRFLDSPKRLEGDQFPAVSFRIGTENLPRDEHGPHHRAADARPTPARVQLGAPGQPSAGRSGHVRDFRSGLC